MQAVHVLPLGLIGGVIAFYRQSGVRIGPIDALESSLDGDNLILLVVGVSVMRLQGHVEDEHGTYCYKDKSLFHMSSVLVALRYRRPTETPTKIVPTLLSAL